MNDDQLKKQYAKESWGKLLIGMGWEPIETESSARMVAEYAAKKIARLERKNARLCTLVSAIETETYGGIYAKDVDGSNWFDAREILLANDQDEAGENAEEWRVKR